MRRWSGALILFVLIGFASAGARTEGTVAEVTHVCGTLKRQRVAHFKNVDVESYDIVKGEVSLYRRSSSQDCCQGAVLFSARSKGWGFEFKNVPVGSYWFVALIGGKQYSSPISVIETRHNQTSCNDQSFAIMEDGKLEFHVMIVVD